MIVIASSESHGLNKVDISSFVTGKEFFDFIQYCAYCGDVLFIVGDYFYFIDCSDVASSIRSTCYGRARVGWNSKKGKRKYNTQIQGWKQKDLLVHQYTVFLFSRTNNLSIIHKLNANQGKTTNSSSSKLDLSQRTTRRKT